MNQLFREEALQHRDDNEGEGELLRVSPGWTTWGYWGILALTVAGLAAGVIVSVDGERLLHILLRGG